MVKRDTAALNKFYVFVDPVTHTFHWAGSGGRSAKHRALKLIDAEITVANKSTFYSKNNEVIISFKTSNGVVECDLPADPIMARDAKINWVTELRTLLLGLNRSLTVTPAAQKVLGKM